MKKTILSVEDDDAAHFLLQIAFKESRLPHDLYRVTDGIHAMQFLYKSGQFEDAPTPDLILLNLNMPLMSGHEVLTEIKKSEVLRSIPVVVLTSSSLTADRATCLALGAKDFLTKPDDFDDLVQTVKTVCALA